jgi:hypothetical protein
MPKEEGRFWACMEDSVATFTQLGQRTDLIPPTAEFAADNARNLSTAIKVATTLSRTRSFKLAVKYMQHFKGHCHRDGGKDATIYSVTEPHKESLDDATKELDVEEQKERVESAVGAAIDQRKIPGQKFSPVKTRQQQQRETQQQQQASCWTCGSSAHTKKECPVYIAKMAEYRARDAGKAQQWRGQYRDESADEEEESSAEETTSAKRKAADKKQTQLKKAKANFKGKGKGK